LDLLEAARRDEGLSRIHVLGEHLVQDVGLRPQSFLLVAQPSKIAAHRDKSREWNVSKQKWNLC
jgi:hypothetical protein